MPPVARVLPQEALTVPPFASNPYPALLPLTAKWAARMIPSLVRRSAVIALVVTLPFGLWGPGPCAHCDKPLKPACHEHQPTAKGHGLPFPQDSSESNDCSCPAHHLCAVPPASPLSISAASSPNTVLAPVVLHTTAATALIPARGSLRFAACLSPPGRFPPIYLSKRSLLI